MTGITRRQTLLGGLLGGGLALYAGGSAAKPSAPGAAGARGGRARGRPLAPGRPGVDYQPVITPGGATLPFRVVDGVKVFHLVAEEVEHEFAPGLRASCWGYNGRVHGPTIEAVEGDRVRIYVTNRLAAPTSVHWHGLFLPNGMDGVAGLNQRAIRPGETFRYELELRQHGSFMYHSHHDEMTQMAMGMMGMLVIHPREPKADERVDRDFAFMLSEWSIAPGTSRPNPNSMSDFNVLTLNAKAYPGTPPLACRTGERVRLRFGNLSAMDHHPIHLHGHRFEVVATDGGPVPKSARFPETTVLVPTGSTRDVELVADAPGDWALHCHMTHHVMNQMGHDAPNLIGVAPGRIDRAVRSLVPGYMTMGQHGMGEMGEMGMPVPKNSIPMLGARGPFDYVTMGGMFTILKVRDHVSDEALAANEDPGWYDGPASERARAASAEELSRDGIQA